MLRTDQLLFKTHRIKQVLKEAVAEYFCPQRVCRAAKFAGHISTLQSSGSRANLLLFTALRQILVQFGVLRSNKVIVQAQCLRVDRQPLVALTQAVIFSPSLQHHRRKQA